MKKRLFPVFLLFMSTGAFAQQDFFALAGKETPSITFSDFRALDAVNGISGERIFTSEATSKVFSQSRSSTVAEDKNAYGNAQATTMAALAYDAGSNSLVYMPMFSSNIYILNAKTKEITLVENEVARVTACDINSHITRMTAGYDGHIYAMNNAGTQFLKISRQGSRYAVTDLGIVKDDSGNGKNSFTTIETGFGGDMIADADGNFYVFSTSGNVFRIITGKMKAKFMGKISGLPENYSVNGAAVNSKGKVVIASAKGAGLYEVDLDNLQAKQLPGEQNLHIYDLASKYFAHDRSSSVQSPSFNADVYPTRVDEHFINVSISDKAVKGNITVSIYDLSGKNLFRQNLSVKDGLLNEKVSLKNLVSGSYLVNITDSSGKAILNKKILVTD